MMRLASVARLPSISASCSSSALVLKMGGNRGHVLELSYVLCVKKGRNPLNAKSSCTSIQGHVHRGRVTL